MRFDPYTKNRYPARPVALVRPGPDVMTVWDDDRPEGELVEGVDVRAALEALAGHRVYCTTGVTALRNLIDARAWTATVWKGRASTMSLDGTKVRIGNLRGALDASEHPYADLRTFLAWVAARNVNPASIGTMATNLWRSTLESPINFDSDPIAVMPAFFGGRQEATPGNYRHLVHYDISAAYPHAMAQNVYASALRPCSVDRRFASIEPGIAMASVLIPPMRFGPLPWRHPEYPEVVLYPTDGTLEGTWSLIELQHARELGCTVSMREAWLPTTYVRPFDAWWALMQEGRRLPGGAGILAKMVANTLWGTFAMEGDLSEWKWSTKRGTDIPHPVKGAGEAQRRNLPHARTRHVAVETTARVRTRLLREGLYGSPVPPLHVDTDGILLRGSAGCPSPAGSRPGQWREKFKTRACEIVAPQTYRYTCGKGCHVTHPPWHYVSAGRTPDEAREHWRTDVIAGTATMVIGGKTVALNTVLERRNAAARIALSHADMSARDSRFPDLSTEEQERMGV
jgi:hypothetical protein